VSVVAGALPLLGRTFFIGIAVAAPVGAMGILCIQRTLASGWRAGLATGLGIATADAIYAGLAAFGVAAISSAFVAWQTPLRLVGGAVLIYLGVRSVAAARSQQGCEVQVTPVATHGSLYASAVGLTLTNPTTIMAFGAIFASAGLTAEPSATAAAVATAGVASGSLAWWVALTAGVTLARHGLGDRLVLWVRGISGVVIAAMGMLAIVSVVL